MYEAILPCKHSCANMHTVLAHVGSGKGPLGTIPKAGGREKGAPIYALAIMGYSRICTRYVVFFFRFFDIVSGILMFEYNLWILVYSSNILYV